MNQTITEMLNKMRSAPLGKSRFQSGKTKLFYITIICIACGELLISNLLIAQNINTTLGTLGVFTIKDASNNYFTLSQSTGQVNILKTLRLENTTNSTTGVIFKGTDRFIHNDGANNTFIGINSGNFTMTGIQNTAVGVSSLQNNTTGSQNTALGYNSLVSNTDGFNNTALGWNSLALNTSGSNNTLWDLILYCSTPQVIITQL